TVNLYKSEKYGIPQKRHRIIIVGIRQDLNLEFKVPAPTIEEEENYISAKEALENPIILNNAYNNVRTRQSATVVERLSYIQPGENAWSENIPPHLRLKVKGAKLSQIYRKLHPDKPSYTITGSGGGGTHGYHYAENRALTNRERARIQSFPDDFEFIGKKESIRKQIGMAVPPLLSKVVFEAILKTFAGISYNSVEPNINYAN
ncbi:MAG: DNA cytosine methyltransferase, partial [Maribacter dokdonensis]